MRRHKFDAMDAWMLNVLTNIAKANLPRGNRILMSAVLTMLADSPLAWTLEDGYAWGISQPSHPGGRR